MNVWGKPGIQNRRIRQNLKGRKAFLVWYLIPSARKVGKANNKSASVFPGRLAWTTTRTTALPET